MFKVRTFATLAGGYVLSSAGEVRRPAAKGPQKSQASTQTSKNRIDVCPSGRGKLSHLDLKLRTDELLKDGAFEGGQIQSTVVTHWRRFGQFLLRIF